MKKKCSLAKENAKKLTIISFASEGLQRRIKTGKFKKLPFYIYCIFCFNLFLL